RDSVLATIVRLLDTTLVRVGNEEYARNNNSFGLTTLRSRHAAVKGDRLTLRFRGKSGVMQEVAYADPRVARIVRRCQELPGQELFQYVDADGEIRSVRSEDVNDYLREASGDDFTAKDFRTWHGSVSALAIAIDRGESVRSARQVLGEVARLLGNTIAVCRKAYVHPRVLAMLEGRDSLDLDRLSQPKRRRGLSADECRLLALL
ncbi:MAG: DNA topoisomerase IB, partial [Betaproteobacteria bacterium]